MEQCKAIVETSFWGNQHVGSQRLSRPFQELEGQSLPLSVFLGGLPVSSIFLRHERSEDAGLPGFLGPKPVP